MAGFDAAPPSKGGRFKGVVGVLLAALLALALPLTAEAHGRKAVPSDPALLEQYRAGLSAYLKGDYASALEAWRPLAERETESSAVQLFLGFMHAGGQGLAKDPAAAAAWYRRAAEQDNMVAQIRLGLLHRRGEGVAQDPVQAYLWASLAARQESHVQKLAQALQEALAAEMTPAQVDEAKRLAGAWAETHSKAE
ncbi:MAG: sel1 repeat family protein [Rhodospirillales bacterium]|nr:sel1 repeat family protein [Rhodospirillales bacterium]